jgi:hypothetical protein
MECDEIKELLSEYVDDMLDPETKAVVDEHLSACGDCQQELVSLKALVSDLDSLESVEAPKDFLDQLHERMEKRSRFSEILRTLFVPIRVKIPLEFAGAVAVAILVFSILHIQKDQLKLPEAPVSFERGRVAENAPMDLAESAVSLPQGRGAEKGALGDSPAKAPPSLKEERVAEKGEVDTFGKVAKDEAYRPQLAYQASTAEPPPAEREAIELALVIGRERRPEAVALGATMETAPAPKKKVRRSMTMRQAVPPAKPGRDEDIDAFLSELKGLIGHVGGEVVSVEYNKETNRAESIHAEIPAKQINTFYNKLKELGELQTLPKPVTGKEQEVLPVRIRLVSPK